ncbi:hypothetical protein SAMN04489859_102190 [Paracoccus alcaliphilus]|uniref:Bacteriophage holin of superfamily 6 (Holin_LLH) n=1 Tax=Paracoccus alcaliphilus TaxID=34002 RepID=A0A1H8KE41_9RHOB|nr:hypothetical protein [Paracoccus alcaliphilus]WCR17113.1 hypothetical protein JHW40_12015 [Paracoccus alcaliphilus]SEN91027.1 hypothetical protein SAMN04489859_102190 [Paracoccus alcaliphilus]
MENIIAASTPYLLEILGLALTGIIGWAATKAREKWGIDIAARHRDALHSALMTGAQLAVSRELTGRAALDLILGYVRSSVPDAIGALKPSAAVLQNLAEAKLKDAQDTLPGALHNAIAR